MGLYHRLQAWLLSTRLGSAFFRRVSPPVDRFLARLTDGRHTLSGFLFPVLMLTTTGRRSGEPRHQPLVYLAEGDGFVVTGSNWGQAHHPAWTHNLVAEPRATVRLRGREIPVHARLAEGEERNRLYQRFVEFLPNYASYVDWSGDREIRVFVLRPVDRPAATEPAN